MAVDQDGVTLKPAATLTRSTDPSTPLTGGATDMSYKPIDTRIGSSNADDAVVFQVGGANNGQEFDTFQFGSTAGAMDVFGSGDGVNYLATAIALIDLTSLTPSTLVDTTAAGKHYGIRGRWKGLRIMQKGATAVENAYLIAHESA